MPLISFRHIQNLKGLIFISSRCNDKIEETSEGCRKFIWKMNFLIRIPVSELVLYRISDLKRNKFRGSRKIMRLQKLRFASRTSIIVISLLFLVTSGCRNQTTSNSSLTADANVLTNVNQTKTDSAPAPQKVKFASEGNVEIVGTFYESPKADSPAILLLHQFGSNRKSFDEFARRLQKSGFGVLAIDGRGFGDSVKTTDGKTIEAQRTAEGVKAMKADVANAFDFLAKQKNVDANRMGIVGASYGSSLALIYAAENPKVKAVALLSPGINYFDNLPTVPAIKSYGNRPLLLAAAEDDKESADAVRKLKQTGASDKYESKVFEKGGHGTNIFVANVGLQDLLEQFLVKNL